MNDPGRGIQTPMAARTLVEQLSITAEDRALRQRWMNLGEKDIQRIREAAPILRPHADAIVKAFYDHSFKFPEFLAKVGESSSNRERLEAAQKDYFLKVLEANFDASYFEHRLNVGRVHAVLNVEPRWNVGNYALYCELVFPILAQK